MLSQFVFILKIKIKLSFYPFVLREISVLTELSLRTPALSFDRCAAPAKLPT